MNIILLFESDFLENDSTRARLSGRRKEHAISVCKAVAGSVLRVGKVNGNMGKAEVLVVSPEYLEMRVELTEPPPKPLPLTLIVAMPRPKSFMKCLEVATVLGIKKMYFMHSFRVEKHYWGSARLSQDYIRDHLLLGLEQARDTVLPAIEFKRRFKPFVEDELPALVKGTRALAAHPYGAAPCPYHVERPVTLAIGPEGGFIPYEVDMLKAVGFEDVSVGERILRVEHAVAALIGRIV